jgi:2-polyprenyl-6-hydroxyphenyl methylase/3-demethylubiquinone-9 3-methyltransferase
MSSLSFDFGRNWEAFSRAKVDAQRLEDARQSIVELVGEEGILGRSFLDIGCGSGLFSIAAAQLGASRVVGFDLSPTSVSASRENLNHLRDHLPIGAPEPSFCVGSILDEGFLATLGTFDIVYAWGVLHHTGSMWQAIENATRLVAPESGTFVVAIYNQHWTSPFWKQVKRLYNLSPGAVRPLFHGLFGVLIYGGVWVTARQNPLQKERGMDFWYDVIDWLGGYPYEFAPAESVASFVEALCFEPERMEEPRTGTGCNEFAFRRSIALGDHF